MADTSTSILIVDDHALVRRGLRLVLESNQDMRVVGEAGAMPDAIELVNELRPQIITLDLSMPGPTGVASVDRLRAASPDSRIIVVSMHDDPAYIRSARALGASGFVSKSAADTELVDTVRAVMRGGRFVQSRVDQTLAARCGTPGRGAAGAASQLSERELQVLGDVARGYSNQQVADRLCLSVKTIESYRARLMQKLDLEDRADLVRVAIGLGLLDGAGD